MNLKLNYDCDEELGLWSQGLEDHDFSLVRMNEMRMVQRDDVHGGGHPKVCERTDCFETAIKVQMSEEKEGKDLGKETMGVVGMQLMTEVYWAHNELGY